MDPLDQGGKHGQGTVKCEAQIHMENAHQRLHGVDRLKPTWGLKLHRELSTLTAPYNHQGCSPKYQCLGPPSPTWVLGVQPGPGCY